MAIPVIDMANLNGESRAITMAQIENACQEWGFMQLLNHGIPTTLLDSVKKVCSENYKPTREKMFTLFSSFTGKDSLNFFLSRKLIILRAYFINSIAALCSRYNSQLDSVKKVCSENYKFTREKKFSESLPVKMLNNALVEIVNNSSTEPKKIENVDWDDVFLMNYMEESCVWPSDPSDFRETMEKLAKEVFKVAEKLLELLSENLRLEKSYLKTALAGGSGPDHKPVFSTKVSHYPP
eukprot:Gb_20200 [translate_table: standard]